MKYILFTLLLFSGSLYGQIRVKGYVTEEADIPLEGVNILFYLIGDNQNLVTGAVSDENGNWEVSLVKERNYAVHLTMLGFEKQERTIYVQDKDISLGKIVMIASSEMLDEIIVKPDLLTLFGEKEVRIFSPDEKRKAVSGLELMQNLPQIFLNKQSNKLLTPNGKPILLLIDGIKTDEIDLMGLRPVDIVKAEYFAQPPVRYINMGVEAVLIVTTKREKEKGGYTMANLTNSFTTGYGTEIVQGKYSSGNNDFSLRYFLDYRDLNENRLDQEYNTLLNKGRYASLKKGQNSDYKGQYHKIEASYSNIKPENYLFNVKGKLAVNPGMENTIQQLSGIRSNIPFGNGISNIYAKTNYLSPTLDVYFSKQWGNGHEIIVNQVNTYYDANSDRNLYVKEENQAPYDARTNVQSHSFSSISEFVYMKDLGNHQFSAGAKNFYKQLSEKYVSNVSPWNDQRNRFDNLYAYIEMAGKFNKLSYMAGVGGEETWLETEKKQTYFVLKPVLSLSYGLNENSSFTLRSMIQSNVPEISLLTNTPAYLDSAFISHGNMELKPYYTYVNSISYTFSKKQVYFQTYLAYFYLHHPYYPLYENKNSYLEKTYSNINQANSVKYFFSLRWSPVNWFSITPNYGVEYQQSSMEGRHFDNWYHCFNLYTSLSHKDFSLNARAVIQNPSLEGSLLRNVGNYYDGDVTWKKNNLSFSLGCVFLNDDQTLETYTNTPVYYRESKVWDDFKGLMYLQVVYTLPFGKNIQRTNKQKLDNTDNDSGIYIDNKAKQ